MIASGSWSSGYRVVGGRSHGLFILDVLREKFEVEVEGGGGLERGYRVLVAKAIQGV